MPGLTRLAGFVVAGVSPRLALTDDYKGFMDLLAGHVAAAVASTRAYEEERRRAEALAELDRAKTAFFSNVSHEFRTPLSLILGPLDDAIAETKERWQRDRLLTLQRNALRLQKLVNTLLDFSRIEAGRVQINYQPNDLAAFTKELASNFRSACDKAGLELAVDCPQLPEPVYVDAEMWEKIVLNLVSNAFKFTFQGRIGVSLRHSDRHAELTVKDTGVGIPSDQMPMLFERFHRVEGVTGRSQEGSGIGLALVRELVLLHGGEIRAESEVRKGTSFIVSIPFGTDHLAANRIVASRLLNSSALRATHYVEEALRWLPHTEETEEDALGVAAGPGIEHEHETGQDTHKERSRILVADDNADMRQYLVRLLAEKHHVKAVAEGQAALEAVRGWMPDLVLTDVMMPRLDGFGLLRELRADPRTRGLPVIMLSARAGEESRIEGMEAGADDYLVKPFGARELLARVSAHLEMARVRREAAEAVRESEAKFRIFADTAPAMLWVTEPDASGSFLSRGWYEFTGQTEATGLGFGWLEAVHPDERPSARDIFLTANAKHEPFALDYRLRRADGEYRWVIDAGRPRFGSGGEFLGYIGSVIDMHERKQAEEALREADRQKDEFLATLSHELRNPLAPLRNGLQVMKLARNNADAVDQARSIMERQLGHLIRLIDDLLDVSRISRVKVELRKERVELARVVHNAVETVRPLIEQASHELAVSVPPDPIYVDADVIRLAQVFANLLTNAAKFTEGGGLISLTVERQGSDAVVRVRDNGVGIPAHMLSKVFDMFMQVDRSLEKSQGGLGIGLTLVKRLVEMHGGSVEAKSDGHGMGCEFVVRLPVVLSLIWEPPPADPEVIRPAARRRILIVDDKKDSATSLAMMLKIMGNATQTAYDGLEALEVAAAFRPDVVLLDIGMPKLNGYDVARRIREQPWGRNIILVALTGWGQAEDKRRSEEAGFNLHMVRPIDPAAFEKLLASLTTATA